MKFVLFFCFSILSFGNERIITLSPALNEIVYALGEGESIVGNTQYATFPKASQKVAKVGGYFSPNLEKILILRPSIVVMQTNNTKLARQLKQLSIPSTILPITRLEDISTAILALGLLLHKEAKAKEILSHINTELKNIKNIIKNKKILIVIGHNTSLAKQIFVVGQNLYLNDIITASGNQNALQSKRKGQPILNQENIIASKPDIVILLAHSMHERKLSKEALIKPWLALPIPASKHKNIYIIDKDYAGIPSDRLVLFLRDFREILAKSVSAITL